MWSIETTFLPTKFTNSCLLTVSVLTSVSGILVCGLDRTVSTVGNWKRRHIGRASKGEAGERKNEERRNRERQSGEEEGGGGQIRKFDWF